MGLIRVLDDALINRIAAGEVVERPASVVKELVENSLDAGASAIVVALRSGGKQEIRVTDDGRGMDRDDALLAVERHATSKLAGPADLERIATLGFRGEALSSIAAVSRFVLRTAVADGAGTEVEVYGGRIRAVREVGLPRGTEVRVERLFFNTPARRKFLRTEATELSHVLRWMTRYALAHPDRRFLLRQSDRRLLDASPTDDTAERVGQIYGRDLARRLLPFEGHEAGVKVHGLAGRPVDGLPRRDAQHVLVNGRAVQDRVLSHAITAAYGNTMPRGRYPAVFLFVEIPPDEVDVNVHPQKTEVRFRNASAIHDLVRDSVAAAQSHETSVPSLTQLRPQALGPVEAVREAALAYVARDEGPDSATSAPSWPGRTAQPPPAIPRDGAVSRPAPPPMGSLIDAGESPETRRVAVPLGQFRDSYIVAEDREGLLLVDQHAAHERVLFERYLDDARQNRVEVQRLLFPISVELTAAEGVLVEQQLEELRRLGFLVEPFGESVIRLDGIPALGTDLEPEVLLREVLGEAGRCQAAAADVDQLRHRLVTTAACHAAIKIHHPLTRDAMQGLLDDLFRTGNPSTCPHGRPALFRMSQTELERVFKRR